MLDLEKLRYKGLLSAHIPQDIKARFFCFLPQDIKARFFCFLPQDIKARFLAFLVRVMASVSLTTKSRTGFGPGKGGSKSERSFSQRRSKINLPDSESFGMSRQACAPHGNWWVGGA